MPVATIEPAHKKFITSSIGIVHFILMTFTGIGIAPLAENRKKLGFSTSRYPECFLRHSVPRVTLDDLIDRMEEIKQIDYTHPLFNDKLSVFFEILTSIEKFPDSVGIDVEILDYFAQYLNHPSSDLLNTSLQAVQFILARSTQALQVFLELDLSSLLIQIFRSPSARIQTRELILSILSEVLNHESDPFQCLRSGLLDLALNPHVLSPDETVRFLPLQFTLLHFFVKLHPLELVASFYQPILLRAVEAWNSQILLCAEPALDILSSLCERGWVKEVLAAVSFAGILSRFADPAYRPLTGAIARFAKTVIQVDQTQSCFLPIAPIFGVLTVGGLWDPQNDEILLLFREIARCGRVFSLLEGPWQQALMTLSFEGDWHVRALVLEVLWIGFTNLPTAREQAIMMNADVFVAMTCADPCADEMIPEILGALGNIGQSEVVNRLGWRATDAVVELLQIQMDSDDPEIAAQAEIVFGFYAAE
jgi:hypothetical protein